MSSSRFKFFVVWDFYHPIIFYFHVVGLKPPALAGHGATKLQSNGIYIIMVFRI